MKGFLSTRCLVRIPLNMGGVRRCFSAVLLLSLVSASCSNRTRTQPDLGVCGSTSGQLNAQVASYDLAVGPASRFIVGLIASDDRLVSFGQVILRFAYCGTKKSPRAGKYAGALNADFLAVPPELGASAPAVQEGPVALPASQGRGVYGAQVEFDKAGFWRVEVAADLVGEGTRRGFADFEVLAKHLVPARGEDALPTENLTISSTDAPREAIDSRASTDQGIPDEELHQTTIAQTLRDHRPALVVFSTPVYCMSRFCGPVTDMVGGLATDYSDRTAFIHIEIWRNFAEKTINKAAAEWLLRNDDLNEPWVFLIGADGKIVARWDNVVTRGEIEPLLQELPRS